MNTAIHGSYSKKALFTLLAVLRFFLAAAAVVLIMIELTEAYMQKDILHLSYFSLSAAFKSI